MKIKIELKNSSSVDLKAKLAGMAGVTIVKIDGCRAICDIPQEDIIPNGKIDTIFEALGGTNDVAAIILTK